MFIDTELRPQGEAPAILSEDAKLLLKAAAIIERDGHCKGALCTGGDPMKGPVCFLGALNRAETGSAWHGQQKYRLGIDLIEALVWNNAPERTPAEVISRLRATALEIG